MWIDEEEAFKKALGGQTYRTWWLLKPSVLKNILSFASRFGSSTSDVTDVKTQTLGGTIVVKDGKVVYAPGDQVVRQRRRERDAGSGCQRSIVEIGALSALVAEVCKVSGVDLSSSVAVGSGTANRHEKPCKVSRFMRSTGLA